MSNSEIKRKIANIKIILSWRDVPLEEQTKFKIELKKLRGMLKKRG